MCINTSNLNLKALVLYDTYVVDGVCQCPECKATKLSVGILHPSPKNFAACLCGTVYHAMGKYWYHSNRFIPIEPTPEEIAEYSELQTA